MFWTHPTELLGGVGHVKTCFGPFRDGVCIGAWFASNIPKARKTFLTHPVELLGDMGHVKSCFGPFGDSASVGAR